MATWQLQNAKARLSEVVDKAQSEGPQFVTRHGKDWAVVLSVSDYQQLKGSENEAIIRHLASGPKIKDFKIERDRFVERNEFLFEDPLQTDDDPLEADHGE